MIKVADNLYKVDRPSGTYYLARIYMQGKRIERSLGNVNSTTLTQARQALAKLILEPFKATTEDVSCGTSVTFKQIYQEAINGIALQRNWKNVSSGTLVWNQIVRDYALPYIGSMKIDEITTNDVFKCLEPIWIDHYPTARCVLYYVKVILNWCMFKGYMKKKDNPADWMNNLEFLLPNRRKVHQEKHREAPTIEQLRDIVNYCYKHQDYKSGCVLLIIATVCRVAEARFISYEEIKDNVWYLSEVRTKTNTEHCIPLVPMAIDALKMGGTEGYIFNGLRGLINRKTPIDLIQKITKSNITAHGIRSTFRDWCAKENVPDIIAEKCLGHVYGSETVRAYLRTSLLDERRLLLERWTCYLKNGKSSDH